MNKNYIAFSIAGILALGVVSPVALAELTLPSGADRRPNLSLDPFERAREAMRKLPKSEPKEETPEPKREQELVPQPEAVPAQTAPVVQKTAEIEEHADAFSYEFAVTMDAFSLTSGGPIQNLDDPDEEFVEKKTGVVGVVNFVAEVDTGAADLWDNGLFFLYSALTFGEGPIVGDLHGISNIDAGGNTMRVVELWYEHSFPHSNSSALLGLHDFNGEFYVSEYASLFANAGFGLGQALGEHGGPSGYPVTTLGLRLKSEVTENSYFQVAMYDGGIKEEEGDAEFDKVISVNLDKNEGVFVGAEAGLFKNEPGDSSGYYKIALGMWYLRQDQPGFETGELDQNQEPVTILGDNPKAGTGGAYLLAETSIGEKMGIFFKHGRAREDYLQFSQFYAAGINFSGAIPGRDDDVLGIGMVHTRQSPAYIDQLPEETQTYVAETAFEITYTAQITDWLMIQPDFQYIQYPSMDPTMTKSSVVGVRAQAVF